MRDAETLLRELETLLKRGWRLEKGSLPQTPKALRAHTADVLRFFDGLKPGEAAWLCHGAGWNLGNVIEGDLDYEVDDKLGLGYPVQIRVNGKTFLRAQTGYKPFLIELVVLLPRIFAALPQKYWARSVKHGFSGRRPIRLAGGREWN